MRNAIVSIILLSLNIYGGYTGYIGYIITRITLITTPYTPLPKRSIMSKPTYQTNHQRMKLKDLRVMFHGCNVNAVVKFEVNGCEYQPVSLIEENTEAIIVRLEKVKHEI